MAEKEKWRGDEEMKKGKHQRRIAKPCSAANRDLLGRMWVTMGISCEIVSEGLGAEMEQTQCNILLIMYQ